MAQMKEQNKTPEKELNKMETLHLLDAESKTLVVRNELSKNLNRIKKDIEAVTNNWSEIKDTLTEMKNDFQGINSGVNEAKNQINDLEHKEEKKHSIRTARRKKNPSHQKIQKQKQKQR